MYKHLRDAAMWGGSYRTIENVKEGSSVGMKLPVLAFSVSIS